MCEISKIIIRICRTLKKCNTLIKCKNQEYCEKICKKEQILILHIK